MHLDDQIARGRIACGSQPVRRAGWMMQYCRCRLNLPQGVERARQEHDQNVVCVPMRLVPCGRFDPRTMHVQFPEEMSRSLEDALAPKRPLHRFQGVTRIVKHTQSDVLVQAQCHAAPFEHEVGDGLRTGVANRVPLIGGVVRKVTGPENMDIGLGIVLLLANENLRLALDDDERFLFEMRVRRVRRVPGLQMGERAASRSTCAVCPRNR